MASRHRALLAGCGSISSVWLEAAQTLPDLEIVGLVDLDETRAAQRAGEYGLHGALVSTNLRTALETARPDVVFDCTTPEAHHIVRLTALKHGCHVLGEKPLADSLAHAEEIVTAAQRADRQCAVTQNYRYRAGPRRLQRFLASGALGRITTVHSDFFVGAHFGGFRERMEHVLLLDMAIHTFDAARMLTGADPRTVFCHEWNPPGSWYAHDASAVAVFEMTEDIIFTYRGSWCAEGLRTPWNGVWRVIGEQGSVTWDGEEGFIAEVVTESGGFFSKTQSLDVPEAVDESKINGHASILREFLDCLDAGATPETDCADNLKSLAMVFKALESARSGQKIAIDV
ncbi:MAG: Gfo/Idh/MocA family protein [Anaerolineae bacterium]